MESPRNLPFRHISLNQGYSRQGASENKFSKLAALALPWVEQNLIGEDGRGLIWGKFKPTDFDGTTESGYLLLANPHIQCFFDQIYEPGITIDKVASMPEEKAREFLWKLMQFPEHQTAEEVIRNYLSPDRL